MAEGQAAPAMTGDAPSNAIAASGQSRRSILIRAGLLVGILAVVFVVILPQVVDYGALLAALSRLTAIELLAMAAVTGLAYVANAAPSWILVPGLSWPRAIGADLAGRAVVSTIPGPTDIATKFLLYRQWSIPADAATAGIVFNAFFETLSDLVLPLVATLGILIVGHTVRPAVLGLSILGVVILAVVMTVLVVIVRSESLARRLGSFLERVARWAAGLIRRPPPIGIADAVTEGRGRFQEMLSRRGAIGFALAVLARLGWFVVLEVALWSVGVTSDVLAPSAVLTTMATVALLALIPITPGAVGVSEIAYVGVLTALAGDEMTGQITAAILLFRTAQWLIPIPLGWVLFILMRGSRWRNLEADAAAEESAAAQDRPEQA